MKKRYIGLLPLLIVAAMLASCLGCIDKVATPGQVTVVSYPTDNITLYSTGYTGANPTVSANDTMSALTIGYSVSTVDTPESALTFRGIQYAVSFGRSSKPFMRTTGYDTYYTSSGDIRMFYVEHGTDKIIGFANDVDFPSHRIPEPLSNEELISRARESLSEFIDITYYANTDIEYDSSLNEYVVTFYNKLGDVAIVDSSTVSIFGDGTVSSVLALPEPKILSAARFSDLDVDEFDAALETQLRQAYPNYHRDDEQMLADIIYESISIKTRLLSLDDDGRPVVLYYVTPQLSYDITYRGDLAATAAEKDIDVHQTGVYEPPVYVAVYVE